VLLILTLGLSYLATAQTKPKAKAAAKKPYQGICGTVIFQSGNLMPSPDRPQPKGQPVAREVRIYALTNQSQVQASEEGFYTKVPTKLFKTVRSGKDGKFCVSLPAGTYSIFVKEEKGLYANQFDGQMNIFPVTVQQGRRTPVTVEISYAAVF